jgi:ABC-2 type transport system ATP-binding protein
MKILAIDTSSKNAAVAILENQNTIIELKKQGKTIFMNSHILNDIQDLCDSFCILNNGKIIDSGKIETALSN